MTAGRPARLLPAAAAVVAFIAVGFAFTRAAANWREYRALEPGDPSAAELYLDTAEVWAAAGAAALVVGTIAAYLRARPR